MSCPTPAWPRRAAALIGLSLLASGCASAPPTTEAVFAPPSAVPPSLERGLSLASRECSGCHAIAATGDSPAPMAPPFRRLAATLSGPALEHRLLMTSELGHYEMRPAGLEGPDLRDLAAYIDSLG